MPLLFMNLTAEALSSLSCSWRSHLTSARLLSTSNRLASKVNVEPLTTSDGRDFYDVLGISPDATQTEVREAFYRFNLNFIIILSF